MLAVSANDVALVGAFAAVVAAVTGPITALLVTKSNHGHDLNLKTYEDKRDAYIRLLSTRDARTEMFFRAYRAYRDENASGFEEARKAFFNSDVQAEANRRTAFRLFAGDAVREAYADYDEKWRNAELAIEEAAIEGDDLPNHGETMVRMFRAINVAMRSAKPLERAVHADLLLDPRRKRTHRVIARPKREQIPEA